MSFVLRMAWREIRMAWARLAFFFLSVAIGVAAVVALRSLMQDVRTTLTSEARSLVGADLVIQSSRPLPPDTEATVKRLLTQYGAQGTTAVVDTQTMAEPEAGKGNGAVKMVELRGVEAAFPYYGAIELDGGVPYSHDLLAHHGVIVQPELLVALGLEPGDTIRLAGQSFTVRGVLVRDRVQRGGGIAFGPRAYVDLADLKATSLLGFGSRASYQTLVRVGDPAATTTLTDALRDALPREMASVRSWQTLEDRIGRNLRLAENYLSLVGFAVVVLGGIGVWSVTRVIVQQKLRSVAILKCLGATSGRVLATYVLQIAMLAAGGSLLGIVLAALALAAVPRNLLDALGVASVSVTVSAAVQGVAVGVLVSLLFALVPLLDVRRVKPLLLLRADTAASARRRTWQSAAIAALIGLALLAVAVWQADSLRAGLYVSIGLAVISAVLFAGSDLLVRATRGLARSRRFVLRHAVVSLARPGNQTRVVVMSVGLGCFFVIGVRAVQTTLLASLSTDVGARAPDLVVIDIQPDQAAPLGPIVAPYLRSQARVVPLMRARVTGVAGANLHLATIDEVREDGHLAREFGLTFRTGLEANERVAAGTFWSAPLATPTLPDGVDTDVSVEQETFDRAHLALGDLVRFDVAGQSIRARVTSVRSVEWDDPASGGFVFVLRPGPAVDRLPHTFVAFLQTKDDGAARGALQRDVVRAMPNVSIIDVRDVVSSIREVVDNVTTGVTIVGAVTLVGGILILVGAVAMTRFQRLHDAAIYRTLGAGTRAMTGMLAIEYGLLGLLAGALGTAGAAVLSWALARGLFDVPWRPVPGLFAAAVISAAVLVAVVGLAASGDVLLQKPLATLRGE
jgi:putative ABC transport system permease protein